MPAARHQIDIDAPPSKVMEVITDFAAYPRFLPEIQSAEILVEEENVWEVRFSVRVVRQFSYTLRLTREGDSRVSWILVEGSFKSNVGSWELESLEDGSKTHAVYSIDLQVGMFVPSNILRTLVERSLPDTVRRFKTEIEAR